MLSAFFPFISCNMKKLTAVEFQRISSIYFFKAHSSTIQTGQSFYPPLWLAGLFPGNHHKYYHHIVPVI